MAEVEFEIHRQVGTIALNRPERKNALTLEMVDLLTEVVRTAATDPQVRAVILTGAGDGFCSGVDLSVLEGAGSGAPLSSKRLLTDHIHPAITAIAGFDKPIVAAVNGAAIGAGMDLSLACDMRIAGRSALFAERYVRAGIVPGAGGCYFLPRLVGRAKALELLLTGDAIEAAAAAELGIVNRVVEDDELTAEAGALAERLAAAPPVAAAMIKRATYQSETIDLPTSLDLVSSHMGVVTSTEDAVEALAAMRERRQPRFNGR